MDISKILQHQLPETNYLQDEFKKTQIFIHHTAGSDNAAGVIDDWQLRTDHVATAFVIDRQGNIFQAFSSKCWAYHLGLQASTFRNFNVPYVSLDRISVAIELCNWGYLTAENNIYKTYVNTLVKPEDVVQLPTPYRNFQYYQKYSDPQLAALKELLVYLCEKYNIPKIYNSNMFTVNEDALKATPGIWTHTSVRYDKTDCFPQQSLIDMLQSLSA